jgi:hypothetical protein
MKLLVRRGVLVEDMDQAYLAELDAGGDEAHDWRPLRARLASKPRAPMDVQLAAMLA